MRVVMWGVNNVEHFDIAKLGKTEDGRFVLIDKNTSDILKQIMVKLPPQTSHSKRVKEALKVGVPIEYMVETGIITADNVYELDVDIDTLNYICDYMEYKGIIVDDKDDFLDEDLSDVEEANDCVEEETNDLIEEETNVYVEEDKENCGDLKKDLIEDEIKNRDEELENNFKKGTENENTESISLGLIRDEIKKELETEHNIEISKLEADIDKLNAAIKIRDDKIKIYEEKEDFFNSQNESNLQRMRDLNNNLRDVKKELGELKRENFKLKEIESKYLSIKDEYAELKEFKKNNDEVIANMKKNYEDKINEFRGLAETYERSFLELKEMMEELREVDGVEESNYPSRVEIPVMYFKMVDIPKYFYSMTRYLGEILKMYDKNYMYIVLKNLNSLEKHLWEGWDRLDNVEDGYSGDKLLVDKMGKIESLKLEGILRNCNKDIVIVFDYIVDDFSLIVGANVDEYVVLKDIKQKEVLGIEGDVITGDKDSVIDITYDPNMRKISNELVKVQFYKNRLDKLLKEIL